MFVRIMDRDANCPALTVPNDSTTGCSAWLEDLPPERRERNWEAMASALPPGPVAEAHGRTADPGDFWVDNDGFSWPVAVPPSWRCSLEGRALRDAGHRVMCARHARPLHDRGPVLPCRKAVHGELPALQARDGHRDLAAVDDQRE